MVNDWFIQLQQLFLRVHQQRNKINTKKNVYVMEKKIPQNRTFAVKCD